MDEALDKCYTGRRTQLSVPNPNKEDFSLFNFLYKNIGKDLSKVSMPITINEPLNMLQVRRADLRLCGYVVAWWLVVFQWPWMFIISMGYLLLILLWVLCINIFYFIERLLLS